MIIKVIVTEESDFEKLKIYTYYYSERTRVMCFDIDSSNELYYLVDKYMTEEDKKEKIYEVTYNSKNGIFIKSEDRDLAGYFNSTIKGNMIKVAICDWWKVYLMLSTNKLNPDKDFMARFSPLNKTNNINEVKTWKMKVDFRKLNWSFEEFSQKSLGINSEKGIQIGSCKFLNDSKIERNYNIVTGFVTDIQSDKKTALFTNDKGDVYHLQIKGWPFRLNSEIWKKNKKISFFYSGKSTEVVNPCIIPKCLDIESDKFNDYINKFGYLSNRSCPTELLNRLKAEVLIRLYFSDEKI